MSENVSPEVELADPHALDALEVVTALGTDVTHGLSAAEVATRQARYGPNEITGEAPPSLLAVALLQLRDPMNLMLVVVSIVSLLIDQAATGVVVAALVVLNVVLGARQELRARASVDALSQLQVSRCRVRRDGELTLQPAAGLVPGDIVSVEAGDLVPADGRIVRAATLEVQEAALTGESVPVTKAAGVLDAQDVPLGDRTNLLFQNTSVTRGTSVMVVTATGMRTQMGQIATMLTEVTRTRSPLQQELDSLTRLLGIIAWTAVALIVAVGLTRDLETGDVLLLGIAMAISAIPTGLPTFVASMLAHGARQLADAQAVVKNLSDVETLGATSAINSDKTGTLTMNEMMVSTMYIGGHWFTVEGEGYRKTGHIRAAAGVHVPDFTPLAYGLVLASDATVSDDGEVVGDPTEAALVVLAAKLDVDAVESRRAYPRLAEVPFDSEYKFMATFHRVMVDDTERVVCLVKGAPDVVRARCSEEGGSYTTTVPLDAAGHARLKDANARMGGEGLRVLAFATRLLTDDEVPAALADPMSAVRDLIFVGMVGIIDPLRPEAKRAVTTARQAGIEVRMITGDHAVTAGAIGRALGLGTGAISGAELQAMSDEELASRLRELHVFGRVTPDDKLRLTRVMQTEGRVVAMTGDAVNDAAALKQADIGVAMGTGSEVTKQAARMILTDDNFGTLVHAVELGRRIYDKITGYVRYQMAQLLSLVLLFVTASVVNLNEGVAMTPLMVLYLNFFIAVFPVIVIATDPGDPDVMQRPPRDPRVTISNPRAVGQWLLYGAVMFVAALIPLLFGPDALRPDAPSASMTMAFAVVGLATVGGGLVMRRDPGSGLAPPLLPALKVLSIPVALLVLATELGFLQRGLATQPLTGTQWLASIALAAIVPVVVEADKWIRRSRTRPADSGVGDPERLVAPARVLATRPTPGDHADGAETAHAASSRE